MFVLIGQIFMSLLLFFLAFLLTGSALEKLSVTRIDRKSWDRPIILFFRLFVLVVIYGFWCAATNRPIIALVLALATVGVFVASGRVKQHLLGEPLVFLDLQFVGQILRHPKLYYGQLLLAPRNAVAVVVIFLVFSALLFFLVRMEAPLTPPLHPLFRGVLLAGPLLLGLVPRYGSFAEKIRMLLSEPAGELRPQVATNKWGIFVPMLAHYCRWINEPAVPGPTLKIARLPTELTRLPHVLAVQCESFLDPRRIFTGTRSLPDFETAKSGASAHGSLDVPCGGAYTMRTEFSFLSGISPAALGCDCYNPYARAERRDYPSLPRTLKEAGWATDFVHPHDLRFFRRDRVMPALGFDRLHGAEKFRNSPRCGPHVSDAALADYLARLFTESKEPRFVFAVTMENHGPWLPGRSDAGQSQRDVYLQHLGNSSEMLGGLVDLSARLDRPFVLCWYGDHAPIFAYDVAQTRTPHTDYLITTNEPRRPLATGPITLCAHQLPNVLLAIIGNMAAHPKSFPCALTQSRTTHR